MISTRRLALAATLALATAAVAVAGRRASPGARTASTVSGARSDQPVRTRHERRGTDTTRTPSDTTTAPVAVAAPIMRVRAEAGTFRREGVAAPHSLQVISVPVPTQYGRKRVDYAVAPTGDADLLSARAGTLPESPATAPRATTVVTRVPAGATAGPLEVARVEFSDDSTTTVVSVELTVARVRRIALRPVRASTAVYPGRRVPLDFVAQNLGNSPDTVRLQLDPLSGWRSEGGNTAFILRPGEQRQVQFTVRTPPPPASGTVPLVLHARSDTTTLTTITLPIELLPDDRSDLRTRGPMVTAGVGTVVGDAQGSAPVFGLAVDGPVTDNLTVRGKFVGTTDRNNFDTYAMGRIGYYLDQSYLTASGRSWSVTGGRTGFSFSPVFGWNAYGLGASASASSGPWSLGLLLSEEKFAERAGGIQAGARLDRATAHGTWGFTATHLAETILYPTPRTLDAAGISYSANPHPGLTLGADAGWRSTDSKSGPAAAFRLDSRTPRGQFQISADHAPGGTGAFARATDELVTSAWRRFTTGLIIRGYGFGTNDDPGTGAHAKTSGGGVGPSVMVGQRSNLDLDLSAHRSAFSNLTGSVTTTEMMATFGARTTIRGVNLRGSIGTGTLERNTVLDSTPAFDRTGRRLVMSATINGQTPYAALTLQGDVESNDAATGQVPRMSSLSLQASRIRFFSGPHAPVFDATAWVYSYPGAPTGGPALRVGAEVQLPSQFALMLAAERNPYLRGNGQAPWVAAIRFERSLGLPGIRHPTTAGRVFDDRNGNGVREANEGGLGGVLVRRGAQSMLTRPDGSFQFYEPAARNAAPSVDVGSLAMGQIAPSPMSSSSHNWALPVTRTARLVVNVNAAVDSLGRIPTTRPSQVNIVATDSAGVVWIAHPDSAGHAEFDALPPGRYTLMLDFTGTGERLRMKVTPPEITITAGSEIPPVQLPYGFRAVRVFDGSGSQGGGRRR